MTVRERSENIEFQILYKNACFSANCGKRDKFEEKCPIRTEFQRDRDRILHCNSFRRLKHKTQVFLSPIGDHYRTRLTHTLEVSQIARTIARGLRLNEDLTEAIALGHDLGHSPFGHSGEAVLNSICTHGFRHNEQSVRVVEVIENLNLTPEVKDGILCHTRREKEPFTREGFIVRLADKFAYINHDIDDAIRAGLIEEKDLPESAVAVLGNSKSNRIATLVSSVIENGSDRIMMSPDIQKAHDEIYKYLFDNVYSSPLAKSEQSKIELLIKNLYGYFKKQPDKLPEHYRNIMKDYDIEYAVCDYISGMSDNFAINLFRQLFIPTEWKY